MDISSELIHSLLPVFMVTALGASAFSVGIIEGIAEATAMVVKVFSGFLSDYFGKRKILAMLGYGLGALTKPLFPLATSLTWVLSARFIDRIGKGIRGAPRDALVADIAPEKVRGAAYGLRQALDTVGACAGPLLAIVLMSNFAGDFRPAFWIAVIPAAIAVLLLLLGVHEPASKRYPGKARPPIRVADVRRLPSAYWWVVLIGGVLTLARFSEAFLVLRVRNVGLAIAWVPLVMVVMNVVYAASAYPAGVLADNGNHRSLLGVGLMALIVADIVLAQASSTVQVLVGAAIWGLHMGLTQGLLAAMVANSAQVELRGTAFGLFNLVGGVALLIASGLAGWLWDAYGPAQTFYAGAVFTAVAFAGLLAVGSRRVASRPRSP